MASVRDSIRVLAWGCGQELEIPLFYYLNVSALLKQHFLSLTSLFLMVSDCHVRRLSSIPTVAIRETHSPQIKGPAAWTVLLELEPFWVIPFVWGLRHSVAFIPTQGKLHSVFLHVC